MLGKNMQLSKRNWKVYGKVTGYVQYKSSQTYPMVRCGDHRWLQKQQMRINWESILQQFEAVLKNHL